MESLKSIMSSLKYHRLPHPPSDSLTEPLFNYRDKLTDQEVYIEANQEKYAAMDRALVDIRSSVSRLQSKLSKIESRPPPSTAKQDAEMRELALRVAELELTASSMKKQEEAIEKLEKRNGELERKLVELTTFVQSTKAELNLRLKKEELEMKDDDGEEDKVTDPYDQSWINDLVGCLSIIIFLVAILVGLHV